jgi:Cof subfamily protein (haloacid dehalogenase superfamily)
MIVVDIDGTLMPSSGAWIGPRSCEALRRAEACGLQIVVATGRRQAYAMPLMAQIGLRPETVMISSNGTVTRTFAGQPIDRWLLPLETSRALCEKLRHFGQTTVFTFDKEGPGQLVLESLDPVDERIASWVTSNRPYIKEVRPLERAFDTGEAPVQAMVCGSILEMRLAEALLAESDFDRQIETHRTEYASRDLAILDILPPGVSKGTALERLATLKGIRREDILAIGDNYNDVTMLEFAGQPVMMGNAPRELLLMAKEKGWRVTRSNDEEGVAHAVSGALLAVAKAQRSAERSPHHPPETPRTDEHTLPLNGAVRNRPPEPVDSASSLSIDSMQTQSTGAGR